MIDLGHLQRSDPALLDDDPFWSVVRRRHPEAEVVLVPPAPPPDRPGPPVARDVLDELVAALREAWRTVAPITSAAAATGDDGPPSVSWRARSGGHALVLQKALRGIGAAGGRELLRSIAAVLGRAGWLLRPSGGDGLAVLDARGGLVDLRAEAGAGATVLTLATGVVTAGVADRVRIGEEVRSWR
ncbi:hypothetical protein ACFQ0K_11160 [Nocardioides caeni]|uniref:Uncharacterized protein n=1 Tax=Nocardioides caeni TaxID=574700 RepID=A0A4S8NLX9_9ACTN|nr:hypothetical protein [Nocardioides caeni]THV17980.1 hypothetical protein E9934_05910 [Nocardioides caeni]